MKIRKKPTLLAIFLFILTTLFYSTYEAESDGFSLIGFPFCFYKYTEGKIVEAERELAHIGFSAKFFLADLVVLGLFILIVNYIAGRLKPVKK